MAAKESSDHHVHPFYEQLEPRLMLDAQDGLDGLLAPGDPPVGQPPAMFEFSIDIGSDTELSDPFADGDEVFDPGDVYQWQGPLLPPDGGDGFKDDATIFGQDPWPDPPDPGVPPNTRVPVGQGGINDYYEYFDLDGHDQIDFDLRQYVPAGAPAPPIGYFQTQCVFPAQFLMISWEDDQAPGWPLNDVPVTVPAMTGQTYGMTGGWGEIVGMTLGAPLGLPGPYPIASSYNIADEVTTHPSMVPNPDAGERDDDDVDSLDIVDPDAGCSFWLFTADMEANWNLDPGHIYMPGAAAPAVVAVDAQVHLGLPDYTDVDAFEIVWLRNPQAGAAGGLYLGIIFSVDEDDPVTPWDESGGHNPGMIYGSFFNGTHFDLLDTWFIEDVDAITNYYRTLEEGDNLDFGDAPDPAYTTKLPNGPRHVIAGPWLGPADDAPDREGDGQQHPNALGDDITDFNDDEDGVSIPVLMVGQMPNITVEVNGGGGFVQGWIDFDGNGSFTDAGEMVLNQWLNDGLWAVGVGVPNNAVFGQTMSRFRISNQPGLPPTGLAHTGEVEDHKVHIAGESDVKWDQPPLPADPENVFYGWNEQSVYGGQSIAADDWVCDTDAAVTDIHWWGSFLGWNEPYEPSVMPLAFQIGFWTDVPADPAAPDPFSHPGVMVHEIYCDDFLVDWVGWDYDPISEAYESCFQFNQILHPEDYFYQEEFSPDPSQPAVFWISIAAVYDPMSDYPWGWKTRPRDPESAAPDDAVRILKPTAPGPGSEYGYGEPIWWPTPDESWDLAFELTTTEGVQKWRQDPNLDDTGMDVLAGPGTAWPYEKFLADDFECHLSGPISDITIWGSLLEDTSIGEPPLFNLAIYDDIPAAQSPTGYSMPGNLLWSWYGSAVNVGAYATTIEYFFDPNQSANAGTDTQVWQYDFHFNPGEEFVQEEGNIYWLGVHHSYDVNGDGIVDVQDSLAIMDRNWSFGWKTTYDPWNDTAVWTDVSSPWGGSGQIAPPGGPWQKLVHPTAGDLQMSFQLFTDGVVKWERQPDTVVFSGVDVVAGPIRDPMPVYEKFLADDFLCTQSGLITQIKLWSSYAEDMYLMQQGLPPSFSLAIYSDVPADQSPTGYSMPGDLLWDAYLTPTLEQVYASDVWEQFYDPNVDGIVGEDHMVWEYAFDIEPVDAFNQAEGNIYWLGVHHTFDLNDDDVVNPVDVTTLAGYPPAGFGWKTSLDEFNDDAVWIDVDTYGGDPHVTPVTDEWRELRYPIGHPFEGDSIDLAFALTTEPDKWLQNPDLEPTGMDVIASDNGGRLVVLADDWECTETGEIDQIIIWGSWFQDHVPDAGHAGVSFTLSIHDDRPAGTVEPWSVPGETLWIREFMPGSYGIRKYAEGLQEGWYDPPAGTYEPFGDTVCWMYVFDLDPGDFIQEGKPGDPVVYWLDVQAHYDDLSAFFGWKTSLDHWNDDAVLHDGREPVQPDMPGMWEELRYPIEHPMGGESIDLAFKIIGPGAKWSQPPVPYEVTDGYEGWDVYSVYGEDQGQIVADDWVCDTDDPVTDVHWWGSFIEWGEPDPPNMPDAFHFAIWKDVAANPPDEPWSHPGEVIWEHYCDNFTWEFVGWDFDPRNPMAAPEATFYFEQDLPEADWFQQDPGGNVYWISISAVYANQPDRHPWGWKTRRQNPAAPDDAVIIWDPTAPAMGSQFVNGTPIFWPTENDSWDMAFRLTTRDVEPPQVTDVQVKGTNWGAVSPVPDYSIPVGSAAQYDNPLGWSAINQVEITFSEDVVINVGDISLTGLGGGYVFSNITYNPATYIATVTVPANIDTDVLVLKVEDFVHDYSLNALDGDWIDGVDTYPSGDGIAGGDFNFKFKVLPGESGNHDRVVDGADYTAWADNYHTNQTLYTKGDWNADGYVDGADYTAWADHYNDSVPAGSPAGAGGSAVMALSPDAAVPALLFDVPPTAAAEPAGLLTAGLNRLRRGARADEAGSTLPGARVRAWRRWQTNGKGPQAKLGLEDEFDVLRSPELLVL